MNLKGEFSILLRGEKDRRTPMKSLNEDIKTGNFKPVYLLYGEEAYLKKQYRDRITKAIFPDGDTVNYASGRLYQDDAGYGMLFVRGK